MEFDSPVRPRFIIAVVALVAVVFLMYSGTISAALGMTVFVGVLAATGVYHRASDGGGIQPGQ